MPVRIDTREPRGNRLEIRLRLLDRDIVFQARRDDEESLRVAVLRALHPQRNPVVGLRVGILKRLRHHADDGPVDPIETHLLANHVGPSEEALLPQPMAQDDDARGRVPGLLFILDGERAAEQRLYAERGKGVSGDRLSADALRRGAAGIGAEVGVVAHRRAHDLERSALVAPGEVVHDARVRLLGRAVQWKRAKDDHAIVVRNRQAIAQHRVDHAQDGGVRADAQRE